MTVNEKSKTLEVKGDYDVIVAGGGIAGISAALSARRNGSRVLLMEREYALGGLATLGLVTIYLPICDGRGNKIIGGIGEELIKLSEKYGCEVPMPKAWKDYLDGKRVPKEKRAENRLRNRYNASVFAISAEKLLLDEGVEILYGTHVAGAVTKRNSITHIIAENKDGRTAYAAKAVVDATGDADVTRSCGANYGEYKPGNTLAAWYYYGDETGTNNLQMYGFTDVGEGDDSDRLTNRRYTGLDARDITDFVEDGHGRILEHFLEKGGVTDRHSINMTAGVPQIRMTRRIQSPTLLDIYKNGTYSDSVGIFPNWKQSGPVYELPYSALYSDNIKNLIAAGRNICATDESWDVTRVIPVCALSGEVAGLAASMLKTSFASVGIRKLQSKLKSRGIKLHFKG